MKKTYVYAILGCALVILFLYKNQDNSNTPTSTANPKAKCITILEEAMACARNIEEPVERIEMLAIISATLHQVDPKTAVQLEKEIVSTARKLKSDTLLHSIALEIAKYDQPTAWHLVSDITRRKERALTTYDLIHQKLYVPDTTKDIIHTLSVLDASEFQSGAVRAKLYSEIFGTLAQTNKNWIWLTKFLDSSISSPDLKAIVFCSIARFASQEDPKDAAVLVGKAKTMALYLTIDRDTMHRYISPAVSIVSVDEALEMAKTIQQAGTRSHALRDIAIEVGRHNLIKGLEIVQSVDVIPAKLQALSELISLIPSGTPQSSELNYLIKEIEVSVKSFDLWGTNKDWIAMAKCLGALSRIDHVKARQLISHLISRMKDKSYSKWVSAMNTLMLASEVASTNREFSIDLSEDCLKRMQGELSDLQDSKRDLLLREVVIALAKVQTNRALEVARLIGDNSYRANSLEIVARSLARPLYNENSSMRQ